MNTSQPRSQRTPENQLRFRETTAAAGVLNQPSALRMAAQNRSVTARINRLRRPQSSSQEFCAVSPGDSSKRNLSAQASSGRKNNWSYRMMPASMAPIAQTMARLFSASMATAMYAPMPGSLMSWLATETASAATRKNQPPDMDIIMFHSSPGVANGSSNLQKRCQPERRNTRAASFSS